MLKQITQQVINNFNYFRLNLIPLTFATNIFFRLDKEKAIVSGRKIILLIFKREQHVYFEFACCIPEYERMLLQKRDQRPRCHWSMSVNNSCFKLWTIDRRFAPINRIYLMLITIVDRRYDDRRSCKCNFLKF